MGSNREKSNIAIAIITIFWVSFRLITNEPREVNTLFIDNKNNIGTAKNENFFKEL